MKAWGDSPAEAAARRRKDTEAAAKVVGAVKNKGPGKLDAAEQAAWTGLANIILNLDETLTSE